MFSDIEDRFFNPDDYQASAKLRGVLTPTSSAPDKIILIEGYMKIKENIRYTTPEGFWVIPRMVDKFTVSYDTSMSVQTSGGNKVCSRDRFEKMLEEGDYKEVVYF